MLTYTINSVVERVPAAPEVDAAEQHSASGGAVDGQSVTSPLEAVRIQGNKYRGHLPHRGNVNHGLNNVSGRILSPTPFENGRFKLDTEMSCLRPTRSKKCESCPHYAEFRNSIDGNTERRCYTRQGNSSIDLGRLAPRYTRDDPRTRLGTSRAPGPFQRQRPGG